MKLIKIDNEIYDIIQITEYWELRVYDYYEEYLKKHNNNDRKHHKVWVTDEKEGWRIAEGSYKSFKDKDVVLFNIKIVLKDIVTDKTKASHLSTYEEYDTLIKNATFTHEDKILIVKYKEYNQKERHQEERIQAINTAGRANEKAIRLTGGMPLDLC